MSRYPNPFAPKGATARALADNADVQHVSDDPGRDYEVTDGEGPEGRSLSSGEGAPSEPRRPGMGERQAPRSKLVGALDEVTPVVPGEIFFGNGDIEINIGMPVTTLQVRNTADRPIQVGSHFHFAEVNAALDFDRKAAWGKRLGILSGGAVRFEPGAVEEVDLVPLRGRRFVAGLRGLCKGRLDDA